MKLYIRLCVFSLEDNLENLYSLNKLDNIEKIEYINIKTIYMNI